MATILDLESLMRAADWDAARAAAASALRDRPNDHVLLIRMADALYELGDFDQAIQHLNHAKQLDPKCPFVTWGIAGNFQALGKHREAIEHYLKITKRQPGWVAKDSCVGSRAQARGLIADCHYRLMVSLDAIGLESEATTEFEEYLDCRGPGCNSIYPLKHTRKAGEKLRNWRPVKGF